MASTDLLTRAASACVSKARFLKISRSVRSSKTMQHNSGDNPKNPRKSRPMLPRAAEFVQKSPEPAIPTGRRCLLRRRLRCHNKSRRLECDRGGGEFSGTETGSRNRTTAGEETTPTLEQMRARKTLPSGGTVAAASSRKEITSSRLRNGCRRRAYCGAAVSATKKPPHECGAGRLSSRIGVQAADRHVRLPTATLLRWRLRRQRPEKSRRPNEGNVAAAEFVIDGSRPVRAAATCRLLRHVVRRQRYEKAAPRRSMWGG